MVWVRDSIVRTRLGYQAEFAGMVGIANADGTADWWYSRLCFCFKDTVDATPIKNICMIIITVR